MTKKPAVKIELLKLKTFLRVINQSMGTKMFQTIYAKVNGQPKDITENGNLSCAFYVSSILAPFGLIDQAHSTVRGTEEALKKAGWKKTTKLKPGVVIIWDKPLDGNHDHTHIGFYVGDNKAISNSPEKKVPIKHHFSFGPVKAKTHRSITALYQHRDLR